MTGPVGTLFDQENWNRQAQIGAATLLILIAVLIVAAATAGVLFDVTDMLKAEAETTQKGISSEIANPLETVAVTGQVNTSTDRPFLRRANFIMSVENPNTVALDEAIVRLETRGTSNALEYTTNEPIRNESFTVEPRRDADESAPTLNEASDRFAIVVTTPPLEAQEWVRLEITTERGATESIRVRVPRTGQSQSTIILE